VPNLVVVGRRRFRRTAVTGSVAGSS
jgi:hypothetical protein